MKYNAEQKIYQCLNCGMNLNDIYLFSFGSSDYHISTYIMNSGHVMLVVRLSILISDGVTLNNNINYNNNNNNH